MDEVWRSAPAAALCITSDAGGPEVQANEAAARWAVRQGVVAADWRLLAAGLLAPGVGERSQGLLGPQRVPVGCHRVPLADGRCLVWLTLPSDDEPLAAVRRATEFLDRALGLANISVWRIDLRTRRIHFNAIGFALQGLPQDPAGVPIDSLRQTIHPDDLPAILRGAQEAMASDRVVDVVARYRRAGDRWQTLLTRRVADRGENGVVTGLAGVSLDLSAQTAERERADALVERSRLVAEAIGVGFWSRDLDGGTAHWDEQMYRIHGRDPAAGPPGFSEWIELYVHPQDRAWVLEMQRRASANWEPVVDTVFRATDADGQERWVQTWTRRLMRDGHHLAFGMHLDVTDRQRAQALLQRERARAQFAIEAAEVGVWERTLDGRAGYWSPEMYRLRGLDPADPRPIDDLGKICAHPEDFQALTTLVERHLKDGTPYRFEFRVRRPDGAWRWLVTQGRAMHGADGRLLGMAGVNLDITERKEADALRQQKEGAEQASREKSAFLARVSHELRTPMNAVLGFTQLLQDDAAEPPTARQQARLQRITEAGAQMMALVDDLLDLSRLDTGPPTRPAEALRVADAARQALGTLAGLARQHAVELRLAVPDDAGLVCTDRRRLVQVLTHLVAHAVRQHRPGGWVELASRIEAAEQAAAAQLAISVRDNGPGYSEAELATLFEPFLRQGAAARTGEGTGIGLAVAQRLVAALGGRLEVQSQPGSGTEFRLWLPAAPVGLDGPPAPPTPLPLQAQAPAVSLPLKVLCVEDNPVNLLLVRELLSLRPGVRLREAVDGRSGLVCALAERPDVLLLDLQLPDIGGLEVLARLRAEPAMSGCVYVALSANAMPDHIAAARAAGFDDYWTKPIDFDRFLSGIDRLAASVHGANLSRTHDAPSSR
jgi:PAS domain S-box-containing protein